MQPIITDLETIISTYNPLLQKLDEEIVSHKPSNKWSKKEVLGHLIDSAQNNIRRFVVAQYEDRPIIKYAQDHWVKAADYQHYPMNDLLSLWLLLNKHMVRILNGLSVEMKSREVQTEGLHSIEWLAADYNKHLLHHLHQVLEMEEVSYP